jgi:hypothetical protein
MSLRRWNELVVQLEKSGNTPPAALMAHTTERKKEDDALSQATSLSFTVNLRGIVDYRT